MDGRTAACVIPLTRRFHPSPIGGERLRMASGGPYTSSRMCRNMRKCDFPPPKSSIFCLVNEGGMACKLRDAVQAYPSCKPCCIS